MHVQIVLNLYRSATGSTYLGPGVATLGPAEGSHTVGLKESVLLLDTEPRHEILDLDNTSMSQRSARPTAFMNVNPQRVKIPV